MCETTKPTKEAIREYMTKHRQEKTPPDSPEKIRDTLDWHVVTQENNNANKIAKFV